MVGSDLSLLNVAICAAMADAGKALARWAAAHEGGVLTRRELGDGTELSPTSTTESAYVGYDSRRVQIGSVFEVGIPRGLAELRDQNGLEADELQPE